jgi:hypothetical protein
MPSLRKPQKEDDRPAAAVEGKSPSAVSREPAAAVSTSVRKTLSAASFNVSAVL